MYFKNVEKMIEAIKTVKTDNESISGRISEVIKTAETNPGWFWDELKGNDVATMIIWGIKDTDGRLDPDRKKARLIKKELREAAKHTDT